MRKTQEEGIGLQIVFSQVLILVAFVGVGYLLAKLKAVNPDHAKLLSCLLVNVFLPCNIFNSFSSNFTVTYLTANLPMLGASAVVLLVLMVGAFFGAKLFTKHPYEQKIYEYSLLVPNFGYMGYALAEGLLGSVGQTDFMIFALPVSIYTYTLGFSMLTKRSLSLKSLVNPVMISTALGIAAGLCGFRLTGVAADIVNSSRACMGPVSMLLAGISIAQFPVKDIVANWKLYPVIALRLLVIPALVGLALLLTGEPAIVRIGVLFYALPCGMNTVVFPKLVDENCQIGGGLAMVSTVLACLTIPLMFALFGIGL